MLVQHGFKVWKSNSVKSLTYFCAFSASFHIFFRSTLLFWFAMSCFENWSYRLLLHLTFVSSNYNVTKLKTLNKEEASREIPNTIHFWFLRDFYGVFFFSVTSCAAIFAERVSVWFPSSSDDANEWLKLFLTLSPWNNQAMANLRNRRLDFITERETLLLSGFHNETQSDVDRFFIITSIGRETFLTMSELHFHEIYFC